MYPKNLKQFKLENPKAPVARMRTERSIVRHLVDTLLKAGCSITVWNGGDEPEVKRGTDRRVLLDALIETDTDTVVAYDAAGKRLGSVMLVYGNDGWDVISDYSCDLEPMIQPTLNYAESLQR